MQHVCLNCQAVNLARTTKDILVPVGASPEVIPEVYGWHCPRCGAVMFLDEDDTSRLVNLPAQAVVKHAEFIRDARIKLNLTLQEAEVIFGGKEGSFSKYERVEAIPSRALFHLLRILIKNPGFLQEIRSYG